MDFKKEPSTTESRKRARPRMTKANRNTPAARLNKKVLEGLQKALQRDPETDLSTILGSRYQNQLDDFKKYPGKRRKLKLQPPVGTVYFSDIRQTILRSDRVSVVSQLSSELQGLLAAQTSTVDEENANTADPDSDGDVSSDSSDNDGSDNDGSDNDGSDGDYGDSKLWGAITRLLNQGEVIYEGVCALSVMVIRISETMVAKVAPNEFMSNEFRTLLYLEQYLPTFPAPRLHGVVRFGETYVLFTTFIPGLDLEEAWPQLDSTQKRSLSGQLDTLLTTLRSSLPHPPDAPLGGLSGPNGAPGEGCKDHRRGSRFCSEPIFTVDQFEDFIFGGVRVATPIYVDFLRGLKSSSTSAKVVFTHGDFCPANIMVDRDKDGIWRVASIIDWDSSGFYPEYWESVKMTNNLISCEKFDWYMYLPASVSPRRHNLDWCIDRILDQSLENS